MLFKFEFVYCCFRVAGGGGGGGCNFSGGGGGGGGCLIFLSFKVQVW